MSDADVSGSGDEITDGFSDLWPTTLLSRHLPGADAANAALRALVLQLEQQHTAAGNGTLTTSYLHQDFLQQEHPAVKWLLTCINKTAADYLRRVGIQQDLRWAVQAWANINRLGDYHNLHNHPRSYLSGTYYVSVPDSSPVQGSRDDLNTNAISFYDPRGHVNMNALAGDNEFDPEHRIQPEEGQLLLWPAYLMHFVHPNLIDRERISVSFNILVEQSNTD